MAVIVCASGPGSPGVTTSALGLALSWPGSVLLADCDREPAQSIQAGYLRGLDHGGRGLSGIARLHRENRPIAPELWHHTVALTEEPDVARRFLPGFSLPAAVRLFDVVWPQLADAFAAIETQGMDVIVDAGRVGRDGLPLPLLARADAVCFISRTSLRSLAGARLYLQLLSNQLGQLPVDKLLGLVLVGPDRPYSSREICAQFGVECWAELGWSPTLAAVLSDGEPEPRNFSNRGLMSQYRAFGMRVRERIRGARELERALTARTAHV
ncbi:hypothetical protein LKO27_10700 [Tessaracoccus sp. OS52]|uniref:hypothetical protein n=1 Tax=Tessaracoccus sp. OS52 TaxID=2886691 RepID=UPI001D119BDD|nr:hypothetical protein [Tessaracoccus sp. OS52]MCC2593873.1 hypothetical protein [Tessaracoccus sp. OS52]